MSDKKRNPPNPTGKGGFGDRPEDINRAGVSSKAHAAWHRAAEALAEAQAEQAEAYLRIVQQAEQDGDAEKLALIKTEFNTFIKNVTDRAYGQAKSSVDLSSEDGSMSPKSAHSDAVLAALQAKHGKSDT
jgi:hypothetical protein